MDRGAHLAMLRDRGGFSIPVMAIMLGIRPRTLQRWEEGVAIVPEKVVADAEAIVKDMEHVTPQFAQQVM